MMRTLSVAVAVLSFSSVCWSAPLAGEPTEDKSPDITGIWHLIAMTYDGCWLKAIFTAYHFPRTEISIIALDEPNFYNLTMKIQIHTICQTMYGLIYYKNGQFFQLDSNNFPQAVKSTVLLQDGCPDCLVLNINPTSGAIMSRRTNVTDAQLKDFRATIDESSLLQFNSSHNHEECTPFNPGGPEEQSFLDSEVMEKTYTQCFFQKFPHISRENFDWRENLMSDVMKAT